jgi:hypothetical protein
MHWLKFVAFNALGAALWVGTWVSVGYFAGQHITAIYDAISTYSLYAAIAAAVVILAWIGLRIRKRRRSAVAGRIPRETPAADSATEDAGPATTAENAPSDADSAPTAEDTPSDARPATTAENAPGGTNSAITAEDTPGGAGESAQDNSARS